MAKIELLAPAKDLSTGIAAINYGADAVYIGAPKFGARSSASNSLDDIKQLIEYAHKYWARVYITMNTIIYEHELKDVQHMILELYNMGADALIVQDMAILELDLPPIALHASTQTHNYDLDRIKFLSESGFERIILARELSSTQIKHINENTDTELEYFVNGALCVSMSGQCNFSYCTTGRSANRGECSQSCRMQYSMVNSQGHVYARDKHLLSMKDLNLSDKLEDIVASGVCSLKIEGRLKDISYIKNIVSHYRQKLDEIIHNDENCELDHSSSGTTEIGFTPDPERTFNRGFTEYFFEGRTNDIANYNTPKSMGKFIGIVTYIKKDSFAIKTDFELVNGDGLCFIDKKKQLKGVQVNKVDKSSVYPNQMANIYIGAKIYRNNDHAFTKALKLDKSKRRIGMEVSIYQAEDNIIFVAEDEDYNQVNYTLSNNTELASNPDMIDSNLRKQFAKTGDSIFCLNDIHIDIVSYPFITAKEINTIRRNLLSDLERLRIDNYQPIVRTKKTSTPKYPADTLSYSANIVNTKAKEFYAKCGVKSQEKGIELQKDFSGKLLMTTRHCLRHDFSMCLLDKKCKADNKHDLFITDNNNKKYSLKFDCKRCEMKVYSM